MSAAPHIWTVIAGQIFGNVSDLLLTKNLVPKGILRKSMHTFGFLFPAAGIGLLGYILDDWKISVAIMTIGYGFRGATYSGHALVTFSLFSLHCNLDLVTLNIVTTCDLVTIFQTPFFNLLHKIIQFSDTMQFSDSFCGDQKCH